MKKLILLGLLLATAAYAADVKISQLPLGSASSTGSTDSFPYVQASVNITKRLTLWDLINLPPMVSHYAPLASPTFTGTVTAPTFVGALTGNADTATTLSATLGVAKGGTGLTAGTAGGLLQFTATNALTSMGLGSTGQIPRSAGTSIATWSSATYPATTTVNRLLYSSSSNVIADLATANTGVLVTSSSGVPSIQACTTANRVLRTDGSALTCSQVAAATDISGVLPAANGGTGGTSAASTGVAHVASGTWSYSAVALGGSDVSGTLAHGNGGTDLTSAGTAGNDLISDGTSWTSNQVNSSLMLRNTSFTAAISSSTVVISLKQKDASTDCASGTGTCFIGVRSSTVTDGSYSVDAITGSMAVTVGTTASLGFASGAAATMFVYYISDTTKEICVASSLLNEGMLWSATATPSTAANTLYCTNTHTSRPIRYLGTVTATWSNPNWGTLAEIDNAANRPTQATTYGTSAKGVGQVAMDSAHMNSACTSGNCALDDVTAGISTISHTSAGVYSINFVANAYIAPPSCIALQNTSNTFTMTMNPTANPTVSAVSFRCNSSGVATDCGFHVICVGKR